MAFKQHPIEGRRNSSSLPYFILIGLALAAAADVFGNQHNLVLASALLIIVLVLFLFYLRRRVPEN